MRRISVTKVLGWAGLVVLVMMAMAIASAPFASPVVAAESSVAPAAEKSDAAAAPVAPADKKTSGKKVKGERAKPRGRLPAYFSAVVTAELKEKIYAIQAEYEPKISQLEQELKALTKARDEKINALLTPEQKKKIEDLKAAAKMPKEKKDVPEAKKEKKTKKATKE